MLEDVNNLKVKYHETNDILKDSISIIESSKSEVFKTINVLLVERNWLLGKRIATEELKDTRKENYGLEIIKKLSKDLTNEYGKGFDRRNLYYFYSFYKMFPEIVNTVCTQSKRILSWSHYRALLSVTNNEARIWYEKEALNESWSVRTLQRNISTQYYFRILKSSSKNEVKEEMLDKTKNYDDYKLEFIKSPVVDEFLEIPYNSKFVESDLETAIINHIQEFLLELGKGYAFVGRQVRIETEAKDYFIDLVFYNFILKCFVLIDIKTGKINHQDVGQMDMYVRMYDNLKKDFNDNPTIGIILCSDTDKDIARYSVLQDNKQLFMSKYKLYLPTEEELTAEIRKQKELYYIKEDDVFKVEDSVRLDNLDEFDYLKTLVKAFNEIVDIRLKNDKMNLAVIVMDN